MFNIRLILIITGLIAISTLVICVPIDKAEAGEISYYIYDMAEGSVTGIINNSQETINSYAYEGEDREDRRREDRRRSMQHSINKQVTN